MGLGSIKLGIERLMDMFWCELNVIVLIKQFVFFLFFINDLSIKIPFLFYLFVWTHLRENIFYAFWMVLPQPQEK